MAAVLKAHGVRFVFTLVGGHISPLLVACEKLGIRVVDTRHEVTAVFAADAVARLTGKGSIWRAGGWRDSDMEPVHERCGGRVMAGRVVWLSSALSSRDSGRGRSDSWSWPYQHSDRSEECSGGPVSGPASGWGCQHLAAGV